jgi:hypothetical protein
MTCNKCAEHEEHADCSNASPGTLVTFVKGQRIELAPGQWIDDKPDANLDDFNDLVDKFSPPKE